MPRCPSAAEATDAGEYASPRCFPPIDQLIITTFAWLSLPDIEKPVGWNLSTGLSEVREVRTSAQNYHVIPWEVAIRRDCKFRHSLTRKVSP